MLIIPLILTNTPCSTATTTAAVATITTSTTWGSICDLLHSE
jgi:hypothetical protein